MDIKKIIVVSLFLSSTLLMLILFKVNSYETIKVSYAGIIGNKKFDYVWKDKHHLDKYVGVLYARNSNVITNDGNNIFFKGEIIKPVLGNKIYLVNEGNNINIIDIELDCFKINNNLQKGRFLGIELPTFKEIQKTDILLEKLKKNERIYKNIQNFLRK